MTSLFVAVLLAAVEPLPYRIITEATLRPERRKIVWTVTMHLDDDGRRRALKPQFYTLNFARATIRQEKKTKLLPKDRSDLAEIVLTRVLLPFVGQVRDDCHVKDEVAWRSVHLDAINGTVAFEFAGQRYRPVIDYLGVIRCESYEVGYDAEFSKALNRRVASILHLLNDLSLWFEGFVVIEPSDIDDVKIGGN